jgi:hypothetical protein
MIILLTSWHPGSDNDPSYLTWLLLIESYRPLYNRLSKLHTSPDAFGYNGALQPGEALCSINGNKFAKFQKSPGLFLEELDRRKDNTKSTWSSIGGGGYSISTLFYL